MGLGLFFLTVSPLSLKTVRLFSPLIETQSVPFRLLDSPAATAMLRSALRRGGAAARLAALEGGSTRDILSMRVVERERLRRRRRDPGRDEFFVPTPESLAWLDSVSLPMVLTAAAVALFTKILMMVEVDTIP
jgi:hypothetical protein